MKDRVRPPKELESILDRLKEDSVFETKQKGLMCAAALGYALHSDKVDEVEIEQYGEGIRLDYFRTPQDEGFIDVLSVGKSNDLNILDPERQEERIALFERFAYLGLRDMKRYCYDERPLDPLLGLLGLIDSLDSIATDDLPGLDSAVKQLGEFF